MQDFHLKVVKINLSKNKTLDSNSTSILDKDFSNSDSIHSFHKKKKKNFNLLPGPKNEWFQGPSL